ncbi:MAG: hypothetical protein IAF94_26265 [Pirellulaceae bacterium]|nr:hypothetical protein [Pirellulaceae bacterium]
MATPSSSLQDLAQRLLRVEAASKSPMQPHDYEAVRVCDKLRVSLTRFAGADGFTSLLRRSLTLAQADAPSLRCVKLGPDGSLEGLEELAAEPRSGGDDEAQSAIAITTHLLGLLVTFIGEAITLRLVREAWPEASFHE